MLWRLQAQRLLVEQHRTETVPALLHLISDMSVDAPGLNVGAIHALQTLAGLGLLDGSHPDATAAAVAALRHPSAGVRRNRRGGVAARRKFRRSAVGRRTTWSMPTRKYDWPRYLALADLPSSPAAGKQLVAVLQRPENVADRWIPDAAICAAANQGDAFLLALLATERRRKSSFPWRPSSPNIWRGEARSESLPSLLRALSHAQPELAAAVLHGLATGWPPDKKLPANAGLSLAVERLLPGVKLSDRALLIRFARRTGIPGIEEQAEKVRNALLAQVDDDSCDMADRIAGANDLIILAPQTRQPVEAILDRVTPRTTPALSAGLLQALARSESPELGALLVARFPRLTPANRATAISVLLGRPQSTGALLDGLGNQQVQLGELSLDQKQMLADHPDKELRKKARAVMEAGGALPSADRKQVLEELMPIARETGDAAAGKLVFKKHCSKCHVHSGEGERIGPELTGMAVHPKEELLGHILDPSRSVEGNFQTYTVVTTDGRLINGILAGESKTSLEILDAEAKRTTLLREDVDELVRGSKSLMPEGLEKQATRGSCAICSNS